MRPQDEDLDALIDAAAHELIVREPGRAFADGVMTRIGERGARVRAPRSWALGTAGAMALCTVMVIVVMNRAPSPVRPTRPVEPAPVRASEPVTPPRVEPVPTSPRPRVRRPIVTPAPAIAAWEEPAIEQVVPEPIVLSAIDLPPLEQQPMTIDVIEIDDITIAPLTASND